MNFSLNVFDGFDGEKRKSNENVRKWSKTIFTRVAFIYELFVIEIKLQINQKLKIVFPIISSGLLLGKLFPV